MTKVQAVTAAIQREFGRGMNAWSDESLAKAAIEAVDKWEEDARQERAADRRRLAALPDPAAWLR